MKKIILFAFLASCVSCTTTNPPSTPEGTSAETAPMLARVLEQNSKAVNSYDMDFVAEGFINKQTYKMNGIAQFDGSLNRLYFAFTDFIFKSPISQMFNDKDEVVIYFPSEKKLFKHNAKTMNLRQYGNVSLDYKIVYALITGKIPLIEGYRMREGIVEADGKTSYLILENNKYYETIAFKNDIPDRIKITEKSTGDETEFYYSGWKKYGESMLFGKLSIVAKTANMRFNVIINKVKVNIPVNVKTVKDANLPAGIATY